MPLSRNSLAVPPVESISTPRALKARAKSTMPVLSDTLMRARWMAVMLCFSRLLKLMASHMDATPCDGKRARDISIDAVVLQFFTQGAAVNAEDLGGLALLAARVAHDRLEQRQLHFAHHLVVDNFGRVTVHVAEVMPQRRFHRAAQRFFASFLHTVGLDWANSLF